MHLLKSSLVAIWLLTSHGLFAQATVSGELRKWHTVSITFSGPNTSENNATNPFLDYRLNVTFKGPDGSTYIVPGFYAADGDAANSGAGSGNKWLVRFTPDQTGQWQYTASFRTGTDVAVNLSANAGSPTSFDGASGNFNISGTNKSEPDNRARGRLNYVGGRYLKFEETGKFFLKAGADSPENLLGYGEFDNTVNSKTWSPHKSDWQSGDPSWKGGKGTGLIGAVKYLSGKGMNAFSFLTMNVIGDGKDVWPWAATSHSDLDGTSGAEAENRTRYDVSKLEQWEIVFNYADSKGMYLHFKTQETENDLLLDGGELGTQRKLYYRELIARFGHHLALNWNLGEENDLYDPEELNDSNCSRVKSYATYFKNVDPYDHHVVIHSYPWGQDLLYTPLLGNTDMTGASIQTDIADVHSDVKRWLLASKNKGKQWVVANDEQGGANKGVAADASYSGDKGSVADNQKDVRNKVLWGTLMAGGAGVEYYFGYNTGVTDLNAEDWRSRDNKWEDAKIAMDFFQEQLPFWQMESSDNLTSSTTDYCLAKVGDIYAIYLPNGGSTNLNLSGTPGTFSVQWFDPRNGGNLTEGSKTEISGGGNTAVGNPPNNNTQDWVALVKIKEGGTGGDDTPDTGCESDYASQNGLVVIEAENMLVPDGWKKRSVVDDFTGDGYLEWEGGDSFNTPGTGTISASVKINEAGVYLFQWRNKVGQGTVAADFNDTWLRFPDASDFYALKGADIVYPKGSGKTPAPNGVGSDGWFKVYLSGTTNWTWSTNTSDDDPHKIYVAFDTPGVYTMEISGRSDHHLIDRITLNKSNTNASDLSLPETPCDGTTAPVDISVTSVTVSPGQAIVTKGDTVNFTAQVSPSNATNKNVTWSSSDAAIATVSQNGLVTSRAVGEVTITVRTEDGNYTDTSDITVENGAIPVSSVNITPDELALVSGDSGNLSAEVLPANATDKEVTWTSSNTGIATVNQNGMVTALSQGTVVITVRTADGDFSDTITITVKTGEIPVSSIVISPDQASIITGDSQDFSAEIFPANATDKAITWSSSTPAIASVDQNGRVTAIAEGTTEITIRSEDGNKTDKATITVVSHDIAVASVVISPDRASVINGNFLKLSAEVFPADATNKTVAWSSSNAAIASVNQNGRITALAEGTVNITVKTTDGDFTDVAEITVVGEKIPVSSVVISPGQASVTDGNSLQLSAEVFPVDATNQEVTWLSSDTGVVSVNPYGKITAVSTGTASITVTSVDGEYSDSATITIVPENIAVSSVHVTPDQAHVKTGDIFKLKAEIFPSEATNKEVNWSSSNTSVATVNPYGKVTAIAAGTAVIRLNTVDGNFTDEATLTVVDEEIPVIGVEVTPAEATMESGTSLVLNAGVFPANATNQEVSWHSSNNGIATVNPYGKVTGLAGGTVTITVLTANGEFTATAILTVLAGAAEPAPEPVPDTTPEPLPDAEPGTETPAMATCTADFVAVDNMVVIEAEHLNLNFGWVMKNAGGGYTGTGYIEYEGEDQFNTPGKGLISTSIEILEAGVYLFQWRNKIGAGNGATESNDTWLRFPDADDFFGRKGDGNLVYPKGASKEPLPNGAGSDGWFKVYQNSGTDWNWTTHTSDNDPHSIYVTFNAPGVYTMEISGRSKGHILDRIVLSKEVEGATDLMVPETACALSTARFAPSLRIENASAYEGEDIDFTISLSRESNETIVLDITFTDDTANKEDYEPKILTVTFAPGETSKIVSVATRNDTYREKDETFHVAVSGVQSGSVADFSDTAMLTIYDEDAPMGIYPNPARPNAFIQLDGLRDGDYEIGIFNMGGELIQKDRITTKGTYPFRLNNMAKGIYIIRAVNTERSFSGKMIVR